MVQLITNIPQYENDIAEEVRMFLGPDSVTVSETDGADPLRIKLDAEQRLASGTYRGEEASFAVLEDGGDLLERKRQQKRAVKRVAYALMQKAHPSDMPWGSLTGIRPTKLLRELTERCGEQEAVKIGRASCRERV